MSLELVKIIKGKTVEDLEKEINTFLSQKTVIKILDVSYPVPYPSFEPTYWYSMVRYGPDPAHLPKGHPYLTGDLSLIDVDQYRDSPKNQETDNEDEEEVEGLGELFS